MAEIAAHVVFDVDQVSLVVDGRPFPWQFTDAELSLTKIGADLVPAVTLTIPAGTIETISARSGGDLRG